MPDRVTANILQWGGAIFNTDTCQLLRFVITRVLRSIQSLAHIDLHNEITCKQWLSNRSSAINKHNDGIDKCAKPEITSSVPWCFPNTLRLCFVSKVSSKEKRQSKSRWKRSSLWESLIQCQYVKLTCSSCYLTDHLFVSCVCSSGASQSISRNGCRQRSKRTSPLNLLRNRWLLL